MQRLADALQTGHPRSRQVTVLQDDPVAADDSFADLLFSGDPLALTQRDDVHRSAIHPPLFGKAEEAGHGISTGRQQEDQRRDAFGIVEGLVQIEGRRLDETGTQLLGYEAADHPHDFTGRQVAQEEQLLERRPLGVPLVRKSRLEGVQIVADSRPLFRKADERLVDVAEWFLAAQLADDVPGF